MDYTLSLDEVATRYVSAGHARTIRTLQRYCASGHLDAQKVATTLGDKYLVTPESVARHIAQIEELAALDNVATSRDKPRHGATTVAQENRTPLELTYTATGSDEQRQSTTGDSDTPLYVERLEREVEHLNEDKEFMREQMKTKDVQIAALLERDRETNILVGSLQQMLAPLLGAPRRDERPEHPGQGSQGA
jgi:hypothetical protein